MIYLRGARDLAVWGYIAAMIVFGGCTSTAEWCNRQLAPEQFAECRAQKCDGSDHLPSEPCRARTGSGL